MSDADLEKTLSAARRASPPWTPARQQRVSWAVMTRIETARRRRPLMLLALAGSAAAAIGVYAWQRQQQADITAAAPAPAPRPYAPGRELASSLEDGSRIVLDDATTMLRKTVEERDDVLFELDEGGARFEVARRPSRVFRVHAGDVTVQVIGTGFRVQRKASRTLVAVEHGRVLVSWWGGSRELGAGEQGTFPPERAEAPTLAQAPPHAAAHVASHAAATSAPDALFQRADRARADGKPEQAIATLRELLVRFPRDAHAPAAAFTIGRLLLESAHKPREAAHAFAEARALAAGDGALAEDALAREVEALHAAGDAARARARAELYRSMFPNGARRQMVARFGGLQDGP